MSDAKWYRMIDTLRPRIQDGQMPATRKARAHYELGMLYSFVGLMDSARVHAEEAVQLQPGNVQYCEKLGMLYLMLGMYDEARPVFEQILAEASGGSEAERARRQLDFFDEFLA